MQKGGEKGTVHQGGRRGGEGINAPRGSSLHLETVFNPAREREKKRQDCQGNKEGKVMILKRVSNSRLSVTKQDP